MKKNRTKQINSISKKLLKKKYYTIVLALFTLGVNIFAWFAFSSNANLTIEGTVASWDIDFKDDKGVSTRNVIVNVSEMKPGMDTYTNSIMVSNKSDVEATFKYEIDQIEILGRQIDITNQQDMNNFLKNQYPFRIDLISPQETLDINESLMFEVNVNWPFEIDNPKYYLQDNAYIYDQEFDYYRLVNDTFTKYQINDSITYENEKNTLYLEKDDADSFFGMQCSQYEKTTNKSCLSIKLHLTVEQTNDN